MKDSLEEFWNKELELPSMKGAPKFSELTEDDKHALRCSMGYNSFLLDKHSTELGKLFLRFFGIK